MLSITVPAYDAMNTTVSSPKCVTISHFSTTALWLLSSCGFTNATGSTSESRELDVLVSTTLKHLSDCQSSGAVPAPRRHPIGRDSVRFIK